jgi:aminoglycoside N3'-acetyltransferase
MNYAKERNINIIFPALPFRSSCFEYLEKTKTFDVELAPNKMGVLAQLATKHPETLRSPHPTHSCSIYGKDNIFYSDILKNDTTFGKSSPFFKLFLRNGSMVLFGVDLYSATCFYIIEDILGDLFPIQVNLKEKYPIEVFRNNKKMYDTKVNCHDPSLIKLKNVDTTRKELLNKNQIKSYKLGKTINEVINLRNFIHAQFNLLFNGISLYGKHNLNNERIKQIKNELERINKL